MTDEQAEQAAVQPPADTAPDAGPNIESLRVTVDADGMVVPDGDPAGQTVLTGQAAADAMKATAAAGKEHPETESAEPTGLRPVSGQRAATADDDAKAQRGAESKAQKAPPEDKGR